MVLLIANVRWQADGCNSLLTKQFHRIRCWSDRISQTVTRRSVLNVYMYFFFKLICYWRSNRTRIQLHPQYKRPVRNWRWRGNRQVLLVVRLLGWTRVLSRRICAEELRQYDRCWNHWTLYCVTSNNDSAHVDGQTHALVYLLNGCKVSVLK